MLIVLAVILGIIVLIASIKYPLFALALFLTTGFIKTILMLRFSFFEKVDYTMLCGILLLIAMSCSFLRKGGRATDIISVPAFLFMLLACILLFGLTYTTAPIYGFEKASRFAVFGTISFLAPLALCLDFRAVKRVVMLVFVIGMFLAIGTIVAPYAGVVRSGAEQRASFLESSPLDVATRVASSAIIGFCFFLMPDISKRMKMISWLTWPLLLAGIIITGSRGPFIGLAICVLVALVAYRNSVSMGWRVGLLVTMIFVTIFVFAKFSMESTRITNVFQEESGMEHALSSRLEMFKWSLANSGKSMIIGRGTGSFAMDYWQQDSRNYPHNIFLELLYELGLIGVTIFTVYMWLVFVRWRDSKKIALSYGLGNHVIGIINIVGLLLLFTFTQALKSSDIDGNRYMFFTCGLVLALYRCVKIECENLSEVYDAECLCAE
jgi:hypothetical protein